MTTGPIHTDTGTAGGVGRPCSTGRRAGRVRRVDRMVRHPASIGRPLTSRVRRRDLHRAASRRATWWTHGMRWWAAGRRSAPTCEGPRTGL